ncbi:MAG: hypothetical protein MJ239_03735 [Bacilli bacterium]|nr:hypothetical protein [Bacilli bacterium]
MKKIVVDIYGGDLGPEVIVEGALDILLERDDVHLIFAGSKALVSKIVAERNVDESKVSYLDTDKFVSNHDNPKLIFKGYNDTSLVKALLECKKDDVDGLVSAGSTGAILLGSMFRLGLFPGIKFPCLAAALKNCYGQYFCLLDCGANVNASTENMRMFASFGNAYMKHAYGIESPRVGLLNVGSEKGKGNKLAKETYPLLETLDINFIGNIEGSDVFTGKADVVVADGFSGNVLLKASESIGLSTKAFVDQKIKEAQNEETKKALGEVSSYLYSNYAYNEQGCSILLGPKKIVAKCHGKAERSTVLAAVKEVLRLADGGFVEVVSKECESQIAASNACDHRRAIRGFGRAGSICFNGGIIGMASCLINLAGVIAFWVAGNTYGWDNKALVGIATVFNGVVSLSVFFLCVFIAGIVFRSIMRSKKKEDPRFKDSIDNYSVY